MAKAHLNQVSKGVVLNGKGQRGKNNILNTSRSRVSNVGGVTTITSCGGEHQHYIEDEDIRSVDQYERNKGTSYDRETPKKKSGCGCSGCLFFIIGFLIFAFATGNIGTLVNTVVEKLSEVAPEVKEFIEENIDSVESYNGVTIPKVSEEDICELVEIEQGVYILEINEAYSSCVNHVDGYTIDISGYEPEVLMSGNFLHTASDKYTLTYLSNTRILIEGSNWISGEEQYNFVTAYKKLLSGLKEQGF